MSDGLSTIYLEHYERLRVISRGWLATVYLVQDLRTRELYALKVISKRTACAAGLVCPALPFSALTISARSPFLCTVRGSYEDDTATYYLTEWCPAGTLAEVVARSRDGYLAEPAALFYTAELALALDALGDMADLLGAIDPFDVLIGKDGHLRLGFIPCFYRSLSDGTLGRESFLASTSDEQGANGVSALFIPPMLRAGEFTPSTPDTTAQLPPRQLERLVWSLCALMFYNILGRGPPPPGPRRMAQAQFAQLIPPSVVVSPAGTKLLRRACGIETFGFMRKGQTLIAVLRSNPAIKFISAEDSDPLELTAPLAAHAAAAEAARHPLPPPPLNTPSPYDNINPDAPLEPQLTAAAAAYRPLCTGPDPALFMPASVLDDATGAPGLSSGCVGKPSAHQSAPAPSASALAHDVGRVLSFGPFAQLVMVMAGARARASMPAVQSPRSPASPTRNARLAGGRVVEIAEITGADDEQTMWAGAQGLGSLAPALPYEVLAAAPPWLLPQAYGAMAEFVRIVSKQSWTPSQISQSPPAAACLHRCVTTIFAAAKAATCDDEQLHAKLTQFRLELAFMTSRVPLARISWTAIERECPGALAEPRFAAARRAGFALAMDMFKKIQRALVEAQPELAPVVKALRGDWDVDTEEGKREALNSLRERQVRLAMDWPGRLLALAAEGANIQPSALLETVGKLFSKYLSKPYPCTTRHSAPTQYTDPVVNIVEGFITNYSATKDADSLQSDSLQQLALAAAALSARNFSPAPLALPNSCSVAAPPALLSAAVTSVVDCRLGTAVLAAEGHSPRAIHDVGLGHDVDIHFTVTSALAAPVTLKSVECDLLAADDVADRLITATCGACELTRGSNSVVVHLSHEFACTAGSYSVAELRLILDNGTILGVHAATPPAHMYPGYNTVIRFVRSPHNIRLVLRGSPAHAVSDKTAGACMHEAGELLKRWSAPLPEHTAKIEPITPAPTANEAADKSSLCSVSYSTNDYLSDSEMFHRRGSSAVLPGVSAPTVPAPAPPTTPLLVVGDAAGQRIELLLETSTDALTSAVASIHHHGDLALSLHPGQLPDGVTIDVQRENRLSHAVCVRCNPPLPPFTRLSVVLNLALEMTELAEVELMTPRTLKASAIGRRPTVSQASTHTLTVDLVYRKDAGDDYDLDSIATVPYRPFYMLETTSRSFHSESLVTVRARIPSDLPAALLVSKITVDDTDTPLPLEPFYLHAESPTASFIVACAGNCLLHVHCSLALPAGTGAVRLLGYRPCSGTEDITITLEAAHDRETDAEALPQWRVDVVRSSDAEPNTVVQCRLHARAARDRPNPIVVECADHGVASFTGKRSWRLDQSLLDPVSGVLEIPVELLLGPDGSLPPLACLTENLRPAPASCIIWEHN